MKQLFVLLASVISLSSIAQPAEFMLGQRNSYYQHSIIKPLQPDSRFTVQHIASVLVRYRPAGEQRAMPDELMNQAYIRYAIIPSLSVIGGGFFSNVVGFRPSAGLSWHYNNRKNLFIILQPRADVWKIPSYELFGIFEYTPRLSQQVKFYSRIQFMSNHGNTHHNRSYQQLRLGLDYGKIQAGIGFQLDQYGPAATTLLNAGVFVQKKLF